MKKSYINKQLEVARKASGRMSTATMNIEKELQQFFPREITVLEQPGDGFVVMMEHDDSRFAPWNIPVEYVLKNIETDPSWYHHN